MVASLCTSEISSSRNNTTIGKFYFVHQFSARESPLCRTGSVESKTNFQNKSIEASVLHPLHVKHLKINKKAPQFLSLTTLPTCDSQCHAAATVPCPSLYPSILVSSSHGCSDPRHCLPTVCYGDVASLCSIFPLSPAQRDPRIVEQPRQLPRSSSGLVGRRQGTGCGTFNLHLSLWPPSCGSWDSAVT